MAFLMKMNRSGKMAEKLDLIPYFDYLLNHVSIVRAPLRSYRKFLENYHGYVVKLSCPEKLEKGSENCPLNNLIALQQLCGNIQLAFADEVGSFIRLLKDWETQCDLIMKAKYELQRAQAQMDKDRQRSNEAYKASKSAYLNQRDELYNLLGRFHSTELENYRKTKEFQMKQASFLHNCASQLEGSNPNAQTPLIPPPRFFSAPLEGQLDADGYSIVMRTTIAYLTKTKAFAQEGIFRVPGQVSRINLLKDAFEQDLVDEKLFEHCTVFEIADVMKQLFRDLPDPILTIDLLKNWPSEVPNVETIKSLVKQYIPEPSRRNLFLLLNFLSKVVENQSTSKMTSENLAVTLWMSFRNKGDATNVPFVVQCLINNAKSLLEGEKEATLFSPIAPATPRVIRRNAAPPPPRPKTPPQTVSHNSPHSVTETSVSPAPIAAPKNSASQMVTSFNNNEQRSKSDVDSVEVIRKTSSPIPVPLEQPEVLAEKEASVSSLSSSNENEENFKVNKDSADQEIEAEESEANIASESERVHAESSPEESPRKSSFKENVKKDEHRMSKDLKIHKKEKLEFDPEEDEEVEKSTNSPPKERHSTIEEEGTEKRTKGSNGPVRKESKDSRSSSASAPPRPPSLPNKSSMC
nr:RhoGAP domain containing protein [Hymenolepis microstoma]